MSPLLALHIASGCVALLAGTGAAAARKGGRLHARAGTLFFGSMLVLGIGISGLISFRLICFFPSGITFTIAISIIRSDPRLTPVVSRSIIARGRVSCNIL